MNTNRMNTLDAELVAALKVTATVTAVVAVSHIQVGFRDDETVPKHECPLIRVDSTGFVDGDLVLDDGAANEEAITTFFQVITHDASLLEARQEAKKVAGLIVDFLRETYSREVSNIEGEIYSTGTKGAYKGAGYVRALVNYKLY